MTFKKYSLKTQFLISLIFIPLNFISAYISEQLQVPFFMDMIFVYAGSFFGIPCGLFVGFGHSLIASFFWWHNILNLFYCICCFSGTFLTWFIVTRHKEVFWFRFLLLIFVSTVVISLEGSIIYSTFFSTAEENTELTTVFFLTYTLVLQNIGLQLSAFFARLPVNLFDKAFAVFVGLGVFLGVKKIID